MFHNLACFGINRVVWSDGCCEGFHQEIKRIGGSLYCFESDKHEDEIRIEVSQWLQELPKPITLFCSNDSHTLLISETCKISNIHIPEGTSLLGVDSNDLICNISDPSISFIELEVEKGGYFIGKLIHQQIKKEHEGTFSIIINPVRVELRQPTEKHNIKDPYILEVIKYIESHYGSDLTIESLLVQTPLSHRNSEVKFKNAMHISIYQYILNCRVSHLADLLLTTDRSLADIITEAGFKDYNNIFQIFKKFKRCSPLEYREKRITNK